MMEGNDEKGNRIMRMKEDRERKKVKENRIEEDRMEGIRRE